MATAEEIRKQETVHILEFCSRCQMNNSEVAGKILTMLERSNKLTGELGREFRNRLQLTATGGVSNAEVCIFCGTKPSADGIVCEDCMNVLSGGTRVVFPASIERASATVSGMLTGVQNIISNEETHREAKPEKSREKTPERKRETKPKTRSGKKLRNIITIAVTAVLVIAAVIIILYNNRWLSFGTRQDPTKQDPTAVVEPLTKPSEAETATPGITEGETQNASDNPYGDREFNNEHTDAALDFSDHAILRENFSEEYGKSLKKYAERYMAGITVEVRYSAETDYRTWYTIELSGTAGENLYVECDAAGSVASVTIIGTGDENRIRWLVASLLTGMDRTLDYDAAVKIVNNTITNQANLHKNFSLSYYVYGDAPMFTIHSLN